MKSKSKYLLLLIFIPVLINLTGCSVEGLTDSSGMSFEMSTLLEEGMNPVTLSTVSMFGGTDANAGNYQTINAEFMNTYPYITLEDDSQSADQAWKTKIAADFAVGNEPDVIQYFTDANASDVLAAGKFVTIEEIRAVYPEYACEILETGLAAAANPDGVQRAVPTTGYWEGLFCNKDLFDRYELSLPTDWDRMVHAIETFRLNGIIPIAVSLNNVPHYWIEFLMLSAAGPQGYKTIQRTAPEDWCRGLEMFKTLRDMGAFPEDTDLIDNDYASERFKNKEAAMQLDGSWFAGGIPDQYNTVVVPFPVIPGGKAPRGSMVGGISSGFYITRKAWTDIDKREAAVKFVIAHTNSQSIALYWGGNGQAAARVAPLADMTPLGISGLDYSTNATSISTPTDSRISQEAYNTLVSGISDISVGARSAEELLNEVLAINTK